MPKEEVGPRVSWTERGAVDNRELIIRLDGQNHDAANSSLLVYLVNGKLEVVATEEHGSDTVVVLSREQAQSLTRALMVATEADPGQDPS
jgi:hypothetical protein